MTLTEDRILEPCPFCGSKNVSQSMGTTGDGKPWPYIECEDCAASAEPDIWNRRSACPAGAQEPVGLADFHMSSIFDIPIGAPLYLAPQQPSGVAESGRCPNLLPVIQWLERGRHIPDAIAELKLYQERYYKPTPPVTGKE